MSSREITMISFLKRKKSTSDESGQKQDKPADNPGLFQKLKQGLSRTRAQLTSGLGTLILGKKQIDQDLLDTIETQLLIADVGVDTTKEIIKDLTTRVSRKELSDPPALLAALQQHLIDILTPCAQPLVIDDAHQPYVILMVGVNGTGKTTTIGKLTHLLQVQGAKVLLAAGDTFRAAAIEQLQTWGERNDVAVIAQHSGADSASVIYDAVEAAKARHYDVIIADSAGRLHTQLNLMQELQKVKRVIGKLDETAPHEVLLVLDATTGQNALRQAVQFHQDIGVTGIVLTKLDGTAKGGIIFAIANQLKLPIRFIGIGEGVEDLRPFNAEDFVHALFANEELNPES